MSSESMKTASTISADAPAKKVVSSNRKKDIVILKNGRTICPKVGKIENVDSSATVVGVNVAKKSSEEDFIADYHYGDSVSNDDEVTIFINGFCLWCSDKIS